MVSIEKIDPQRKDVTQLIAELDDMQSTLYPPESNYLEDATQLKKEGASVFGIFVEGNLAGIAALKPNHANYAEIKRMYLKPEFRGKGLADVLFESLEAEAAKQGASAIRLETGIYQVSAIHFYKRHGFKEIDAFGEYAPDPLCVFMEKPVIAL